MPWVGRFSPGNGPKMPCFFEAKLHKRVGPCWEIGRFFALGGLAFVGVKHKALCFFDEELYKITECCRGRGCFFALDGLVFVGG